MLIKEKEIELKKRKALKSLLNQINKIPYKKWEKEGSGNYYTWKTKINVNVDLILSYEKKQSKKEFYFIKLNEDLFDVEYSKRDKYSLKQKTSDIIEKLNKLKSKDDAKRQMEENLKSKLAYEERVLNRLESIVYKK